MMTPWSIVAFLAINLVFQTVNAVVPYQTQTDWIGEQDWDAPQSFSCPRGFYISAARSFHDNGREDRKYSWRCASLRGNIDWISSTPSQTGWVNSYDNAFSYEAPAPNLFVGWYSVHDNGREDRQFQVRIMAPNEGYRSSCQFFGYSNNYDGNLNFQCPSNQFMYRAYSVHSNSAEDRIWRYGCCAIRVSAPILSSLSVGGGQSGNVLVVYGSGFGRTIDDLIITVDGVTCPTAGLFSSTQKSCFLPSLTNGIKSIRISRFGELSSNTLPFEYVPTPQVTSVSPTGGLVGTSISVSGSGFGSSLSNLRVLIGTRDCSNVALVSDSLLTCNIPSNTQLGRQSITVRRYEIQSTGFVQFEVIQPPEIIALSPSGGEAGDIIRLTMGFLSIESQQSNLAVTIGGVTCPLVGPPSPVSGSSFLVTLQCTVPSLSPTTYDVVVSHYGIASSPVSFLYTSGPAIVDIFPQGGTTGDIITISGYRFGENEGDISIQVGTAECLIFPNTLNESAVDQTSSIRCQVPPQNDGVYPVTLRRFSLVSSSFDWNYVQPPVLTRIDPPGGESNYTVTIYGEHFGEGPISLNLEIFIGDNTCLIVPFSLSENGTSVQCIVPERTGQTSSYLLRVKRFEILAQPLIFEYGVFEEPKAPDSPILVQNLFTEVTLSGSSPAPYTFYVTQLPLGELYQYSEDRSNLTKIEFPTVETNGTLSTTGSFNISERNENSTNPCESTSCPIVTDSRGRILYKAANSHQIDWFEYFMADGQRQSNITTIQFDLSLINAPIQSEQESKDESFENTPVFYAIIGIGSLLFIALIVAIVALLVAIQRKKKIEWAAGMINLSPLELTQSIYSPISDQTSSTRITYVSESNNWEIKYEDLEIGDEIGRGNYGVVHKGVWRGGPVALKFVSGDFSDEKLNDFKSEVALMKHLRPHSSVVLFLGVCQYGEEIILVTEYLPGGSLKDYVYGKFPLDRPLINKILQGVSSGMQHLMAEGILHRDLSARNILLSNSFDVKVCDFGLSLLNADASKNTMSEGPIKWMAPETLCVEQEFSEKSDVWSYGILVYEILRRGEPYENWTIEEVVVKVVKEKYQLPPPKEWENTLEGRLQLKCLSYEPDNRPTFKEISKLLSLQGRL